MNARKKGRLACVPRETAKSSYRQAFVAAQAPRRTTVTPTKAAARPIRTRHGAASARGRTAATTKTWFAGSVSAMSAVASPAPANHHADGRRAARTITAVQTAKPAANTISVASSWNTIP